MQTMKSRSLYLTAALAAVLVATACSAGSDADTGSGSGTAPASSTLNAAIAVEPDQFDPQKTTADAGFEVLENIFDTLVEPDEKLQMQPALAESWTTADDQLSWTFKLRTGVTFHNGDPFDADDVVYSFDRIIDDKLSTAHRFDSVQDVVALDPATVKIELKRPTPNLLTNIGSFKGVAIVDEKNVEDGEISSKPVGTGPFYFEAYQRGTAITLRANDKYWGGKPQIDRIKFSFVNEPSAALVDLKGGQVQWTDNLPPASVSGLLGSTDPTVQSVPSNDYWCFALNEKKKPFNDVRVRQAFAWAIDRDAIAEAARLGAAQVNQTAIPRTSAWYYDYAPYRTDPVRARTLLQQAGVKNLKVDFMVTSEYPETVAVARVMKEQLSEVGITLNVRIEDFAGWLADEAAGTFDGFMLNRLGSVDPDEFYYSQHVSKGSNNYQKFSNPQVDKLLEQGRTETDQVQREEAYESAARLIVDQASYVYLYNPNVVQGWSPALKGYQVRPDRAIRFRDASLGN